MMMRYKLYKHKKQWLIGCTVVTMATLGGMTSVQAATSANNGDGGEPATSLTQTTQSTNNVVQSANVPNNQPATAKTSEYQHEDRPQSMEGWQFVAQNDEGRQVYAEPIQRNTTQTNTSYGSEINPNNYTVHIGISGLDYTIPPYKLVDGDLRFATNEEAAHIPGWHQPALVDGKAVNVGTYAVFLSQAGFDHLQEWVNGIDENGQWVLQPGVENITLGSYNFNFLLNMWSANRPTYTITPYFVKGEVTGTAPLGTDGLDLLRYHVQLLSGQSGQSSINPFQTGFDRYFQLQAGDLQVGNTPLTDGSYPVQLTNQGWQHVLIALEKAFNSYGNVDHQPNFICQQTDVKSSATASLPADQVKTVTRTIKIYLPGQQPRVVIQTATIRRQATIKDGHLAWEGWTSAQWPQLTVPVVTGYTASPATIPATTVTDLTTDQVMAVHYFRTTATVPTGQPATTIGRRSGSKTITQIGHNGSQPAANRVNHDQQQLPQTGNSQDGIAAVGLGLMGLMTMLGLGKKKPERD